MNARLALAAFGLILTAALLWNLNQWCADLVASSPALAEFLMSPWVAILALGGGAVVFSTAIAVTIAALFFGRSE